MEKFKQYLLSHHIATEKQLPFYVNWVSQFYNFKNKAHNESVRSDDIEYYLNQLDRRKKDWQVQQAREAIMLYQLFLSRSNRIEWNR